MLFTALYVAPFYLSSTLRASPLASRDSPAVIRARVRAVALSCLASTIVAVYLIVHYGHATATDVLRLLGIWPVALLDIAKALALVSILFVGPIYEALVVEGGLRDISPAAIKETFFDSWTGYRNHLVAPVSEELVFRSLVISLYLLAKVKPTRIVFITPLIFGLAHLHHFAEFIQSRVSLDRSGSVTRVVLMGLLRTLFQMTYTALFGFFEAFVFLRTGNLYAAIAAHMLCNLMGFPRVWGRVGQDAMHTTATPDVAQGKRDDNLEAQRSTRPGFMHESAAGKKHAIKVAGADLSSLGVQWTVVYYVLLVIGAYGFYRMLWPLTESTYALAKFWDRDIKIMGS